MAAKQTEKVTIQLFKDNEKYKDDVFVAVNGHSYQVKRGVKVEVPAKVAEVLEHSSIQDMKTADLMDQESNKFREKSKAYGVE